jgi:hypothetical protein
MCGFVRKPTIRSALRTAHTSRAVGREKSAPSRRQHRDRPRDLWLKLRATPRAIWMFARVDTGPSIRPIAAISHMAEGHAASAMCDEHSSGKARGRAPPSLSSGRFSARVRHFFVADGLDPNTLSCHVSRRRGAQQLRRAVKHRSKARRTSRRSKDDSRLTAFTASSSVSTMKPLIPSSITSGPSRSEMRSPACRTPWPRSSPVQKAPTNRSGTQGVAPARKSCLVRSSTSPVYSSAILRRKRIDRRKDKALIDCERVDGIARAMNG